MIDLNNHASCIFKKFTCYNCPSYGCLGKTTHTINFTFAILNNAENKDEWHSIIINQFLNQPKVSRRFILHFAVVTFSNDLTMV